MLNLLNSIVENTMEGTLKHDVAEIILDELTDIEDDEILSYMRDIIDYGCVSGTVKSLITYKDTEKFFNKHADEIFDLMNEKRDDGWDLNNIEFNKNNLTWFAFETIAQEIYYEMEVASEF